MPNECDNTFFVCYECMHEVFDNNDGETPICNECGMRADITCEDCIYD